MIRPTRHYWNPNLDLRLRYRLSLTRLSRVLTHSRWGRLFRKQQIVPPRRLDYFGTDYVVLLLKPQIGFSLPSVTSQDSVCHYTSLKKGKDRRPFLTKPHPTNPVLVDTPPDTRLLRFELVIDTNKKEGPGLNLWRSRKRVKPLWYTVSGSITLLSPLRRP